MLLGHQFGQLLVGIERVARSLGLTLKTILLCWVFLGWVVPVWVVGQLFCVSAQAQSTGSPLDVPQTRLTPLGNSSAALGSPAPLGGLAGSTGIGGNYGSAAGASGSLIDPYAGGPAAGYVAPSPPPTAQGGFFGGLLSTPSNTAPQGGVFAPAAPPFASGGPVYGGLANQPPPVFGSGGVFGQGGIFGGQPLGAATTTVPPSAYSGPAFSGSTFSGPNPGAATLAAPGGFTSPATAFPSGAPSTLFPGGLFANTPSYAPQINPYRLIQRARFRHTFLFGGEDPDDLAINDTDIALAFALPRFLWSTQPLYLAPSFSFHQWDGPQASTGADLPPNTYSAFLDASWQSDPNRILGAELAVSVGVFSEFDVIDADSLRVRGKGLGSFRLTPATTLKLGVYYYDRVRVKLLPAGGLFWRPNPFTRVDLFFPQPKYSRYLSTVGTHDVWWYVSGEYGGGSWTIERDDGADDQVDLNDIRLLLGMEWGPSERMRLGMRTMFFEVGYVGDREIFYRHNPKNISLDDTWLVRLGVGY